MKRLNRWIPVLVLAGALGLFAGCGEEESADGESSEEGSDTIEEGEGEEAEEAKPDDEASKTEAAKDDADKAPEAAETAEVAKPLGPEAVAAMKDRCGAAFDNTIAIMQTAGAPPQIVTQMRAQRDKTVGTCLEQAKVDPAGTRMLDCMIAARLPADIQTCTRKFGDIKPPAPVDDGHGH